jgi:putative flippase GtrA
MKYARISKFILAGGFSTGIHLGIVVLLMSFKVCGIEVANGVAYLVSTIFNLSVNTVWSFRQELTRKIIQRYMLVSAIGLLLAMVVAHINDICGYDYLIGIAMIVCLCPAVTYMMHVNYTYKKI